MRLILNPLFVLAVTVSCAFMIETSHTSEPAVLTVGPNRDYSCIEDAVAAAQPGTVINVYPQPGGQPYSQVHVLVRKSGITLRSADVNKPVVLDGAGFDYSGQGSTPRAIVQFDPGADNCRLEGFVLQNATNQSHNAAGVRINQANGVLVTRCLIQNNDMGVMSNGSAVAKTGYKQQIDNCRILRNGSTDDPGYNHNLYLGGHSVMVRGCEIGWSLTGHNIKSRAHLNVIVNCHIHDAANREIDLVDSKDCTDVPNSNSFVRNCRIVKAAECSGNRNCIHFGQDGGNGHNGTFTLEKNRIETPFPTPVVDLSAAEGAVLKNNIVVGSHPQSQGVLVKNRTGKKLEIVVSGNTLPQKYQQVTE